MLLFDHHHHSAEFILFLSLYTSMQQVNFCVNMLLCASYSSSQRKFQWPDRLYCRSCQPQTIALATGSPFHFSERSITSLLTSHTFWQSYHAMIRLDHTRCCQVNQSFTHGENLILLKVTPWRITRKCQPHHLFILVCKLNERSIQMLSCTTCPSAQRCPARYDPITANLIILGIWTNAISKHTAKGDRT